MGIIATRSFDEQVMGIDDLMKQNEARIRNGMVAYGLLEKLRSGFHTEDDVQAFNEVKKDLGYGLLLKSYTNSVVDATEAQIKQATEDTIPQVAPLFWSFRIMVGCGMLMVMLFALATWYSCRESLPQKRWLLKLALSRCHCHGLRAKRVGLSLSMAVNLGPLVKYYQLIWQPPSLNRVKLCYLSQWSTCCTPYS